MELPGTDNRIRQLDGLRGIAILLVVFYHYIGMQLEATDITTLNIAEKILMKITLVGWCGVDLFFVLSGFLIGSVLLKNTGSNSFFKTFYIRRFCRILPVYYVLLVLFILIKHSSLYDPNAFIFKNYIPIVWYFGFLQNIAMGIYKHFGPHSISVSWSLAVEEQFYLIIPLLIYYIRPKYYKYLIAAGILMALVSRALLPSFYQQYTWLICRIDAPMTGFMIALLMREQKFKTFAVKNLGWLVLAAAALFAITIAGHAYLKLGFINHSLSAFLFGLVLIIVLFTEKGFFYKLLTTPALLLMGKISFFFYLFHQLLNGLGHLVLLHQSRPMLDSMAAIGVTVMSFVLTLLAGIVSFKYFEGPLIRFSHKYKY